MMATKAKTKTTATAANYKNVLRPVITEKATYLSQNNQIVFRVPLTATKTEIADAVEGIWGVKVASVNTIRSKGKVKQFRGSLGRRSDSKKAVVTLAEGAQIDIGASV
jgi:large subunit ribosomal protein L23